MIFKTLAVTGLFCLAASAQQKTIFVDKMGGLESYVEEAIRKSEAQVEFIEEAAHPDLKLILGKQFSSVHLEVLYKAKTGRQAQDVLSAIDVKTGKEIASYSFDPQTTEVGKKSAATAFASALRPKLKELGK